MKQDYEVLVVDDDKIISFLHSRLLINLGIKQPLVFTKAQEALNFLYSSENAEVCFLVLLDVHMPELNAWDFLEACKRMKPSNLKIAIVTSSMREEDKLKAEEYDLVFGYYEKPLLSNKLKEILTNFQNR